MTTPGSFVWEIVLGDQAVEVRDLPLTVIARIARVTETAWPVVVGMPYADLAVASLLLEAAAEMFGVQAPTMDQLTPRTVLEYFVDVSERDEV